MTRGQRSRLVEPCRQTRKRGSDAYFEVVTGSSWYSRHRRNCTLLLTTRLSRASVIGGNATSFRRSRRQSTHRFAITLVELPLNFYEGSCANTIRNVESTFALFRPSRLKALTVAHHSAIVFAVFILSFVAEPPVDLEPSWNSSNDGPLPPRSGFHRTDFNKYTPLTDPKIRDPILALARANEIPAASLCRRSMRQTKR